MPQLQESLPDRLAIAEAKIDALAGMHDQLERLVEVLQGQLFALQAVVAQFQGKQPVEGCPVPSADAVDVADMGSDERAIAAIIGAAAIAAQGDDALPDGMISR